MRNIYKMFPELVMVDDTYKLLDLKLPVYFLLAVDGDGLSEIVALFIVAEEAEPVFVLLWRHLRNTTLIGKKHALSCLTRTSMNIKHLQIAFLRHHC